MTNETTYKQIEAASATKKDYRDLKEGERLIIKCRDKDDVRRCKRLATLCKETGWAFATSFHPIPMLLSVKRVRPDEADKPQRQKSKLSAAMCKALRPGERRAIHYDRDCEINTMTAVVYRARNAFGLNLSRQVEKSTRTFYVIRRPDK